MKKTFISTFIALSAFIMPAASWAQTTSSTTEDSRTSYQTVVGRIAFKSISDDQRYRIPSIVRLDENHVVAFADRRPNGNKDMGTNCTNYIVYKLGTKTTTDGKDVWNFGDEQTILAHTTYKDQNNTTQNNAASDAATVYDKEHKVILVISTGGNIAYGSGKTQMVRRYIKYDDTNHTLSPVEEDKWYDGTTECAKEFSSSIYGLFSNNAGKDQVTSAFFTSGEICQSRIVKTNGYYRLYAALCTRPNGTKVIYSDDLGKTWNVLVDAKNCPAPKGDESKIAELPDGRLLLSTRMYNKNANNQAVHVHGRYMNVFTYKDGSTTEGYWSQPASTDNTVKGWDKNGNPNKWSDDPSTTWLLGAGAVNGAVAFVPAKSKDGSKQVYIALQSMPARINTSSATDPGTDNLTIFWKVFEKPDDYLHVGYNGESNTVDDKTSIKIFDPKLMAVQGDPETFRYGWKKFSLNNASSTQYAFNCETRYSAMVQNGVDGVDLLSEEYRSNDCNDIVYRQLSLSQITKNAYTYVPETEEVRKAYVNTGSSANEAPLPGNVYTVKVRWSVTENGTTTVTEKYLSSNNLKKFYDNETMANLSFDTKKDDDEVDESYLWTLQCDPDAYTSGSNGIQQPFFYMSSLSGVGYLGRTKGWYWSGKTPGWKDDTGTNLTPKMGKELKILEIHKEWMEPDQAYAQTDKPMEQVVKGNTLVIQRGDNGSRGALAFALETGESNWLGYSTSNASYKNNDIIAGNENNSTNKTHMGKYSHLHWSTDIIFTRVTLSDKVSADAPYGTFANPTYPMAPSKEIYLVRSNNGTAKAYKKFETGETIDDYNYYGTIRLPYAVTVPLDVKVYTVSKGQLLEKGVYDKRLNMTELVLNDRVLPRETPVVLCKENTEGENAALTQQITLTPTAAQKPQSTGFNGTLGEMWFYDQSNNKDTYSSATGDASNNFYYVFGKKNGRVAFYALGRSTKEDSKGKYVIPANKAYFVLPKASGAKAAPSLDFGFEGMEVVTGINGVKASQSQNETKVYSLDGQYLGNDFNRLPKGIYIVNGEKVVK